MINQIKSNVYIDGIRNGKISQDEGVCYMDKDPFKEYIKESEPGKRDKGYAWYFRNFLVRANYNNLKDGIYETTEYLELFLRNLLLDEKNELHNRSMHISGLLKADIDDAKANIEKLLANIDDGK